MEQTQILIVDDEKEIAELVEIHLVSNGFQVHKAYSAKEGMNLLGRYPIKLVILDIMMPEVDGLTMCSLIRKNSNIPIILLSAKSTDLDKIVGLSTGADDYVAKPFNPLELMARVKSQLRRYTTLNTVESLENNAHEIETRCLRINRQTRKVESFGKEAHLTPIEFDILWLLASHPGRVFSTDEIFERVWNEKMFEANNTVMVHIRRLREKIEPDARNAEIIKTVWGVGYKIEK